MNEALCKRLNELGDWCSANPIHYASREQQQMYQEKWDLEIKFAMMLGRYEVIGHLGRKIEELRKQYQTECEDVVRRGPQGKE